MAVSTYLLQTTDLFINYFDLDVQSNNYPVTNQAENCLFPMCGVISADSAESTSCFNSSLTANPFMSFMFFSQCGFRLESKVSRLTQV